MRRLIILPALMGVLLLYSFHCHKDDKHPDNGLLKGKLVINGPCGSFVVQLLEGSMAPDKIAASWKYSQTDSVYTNVFTIENSCTFAGYRLSKGDVFTFQLDPLAPMEYCARCQIYAPTPREQNIVKNVKKVN